MGNDVFANGREIACKAADGKSICAFPDVCFTPPQTPATPPGVPIPYPNTGLARDTTYGSRTIKISGKEVMLKNKSYFKKSLGDEAGCAPKKGILTSVNRGKVYFTSWSMDVKYEGKNVVRHLDLTTHNHASESGQTAPWPYQAFLAADTAPDPCKEDKERERSACAQFTPYGTEDACGALGLTAKPGQAFDIHVLTEKGLNAGVAIPAQHAPVPRKKYLKKRRELGHLVGERADALDAFMETEGRGKAAECIRARRCRLEPYDKNKTGCCKGQTPHHLIEASAFFRKKRGKSRYSVPISGMKWTRWRVGQERPRDNYNELEALCVCAEGTSNTVGSHGFMHTKQSQFALKCSKMEDYSWPGRKKEERLAMLTYQQARDNSIKAMQEVFAYTQCDPNCLKLQLDAYHKGRCGIEDGTKLKAVICGKNSDEARLLCDLIISQRLRY